MTTWIFQGNPKTFDIDGYLRASAGTIQWRVAHSATQMKPGDQVFLWRSGGEADEPAGIIADGILLEQPHLQRSDRLSNDFWKKPPSEDMWVQVAIRLNRIATKKEVLKRDWMKDDKILSTLGIMRQPAGTNYRLDDAQAHRLSALWSRTGEDWNRSEIVAALHLYEQVKTGQISKLIDSPVEQVAQTISRAPTSVYNKIMNFRALDPRAPQAGLDGSSKLDKQVWEEFFDAVTAQMQSERLEAEYIRLWGEAGQAEEPREEAQIAEQLATRSLASLMEQYQSKQPVLRPTRHTTTSAVFARDPLVVAIRKKLANNRCEVPDCTNHTFQTDNGEFYVEVHHIVPLSEGGEDSLENTAAICANHHKHIHHAKLRGELREVLLRMRLGVLSR